jgi:hypothetical protein
VIQLKTKWFNKWARKNAISDNLLISTIELIPKKQNCVSLGGGLYKVRTSRVGEGKSGGYRTLLVYKEKDRAIFIYGSSKSEKDNIETQELKYFKKLAIDLLKIAEKELLNLERSGIFIKLEKE